MDLIWLLLYFLFDTFIPHVTSKFLVRIPIEIVKHYLIVKLKSERVRGRRGMNWEELGGVGGGRGGDRKEGRTLHWIDFTFLSTSLDQKKNVYRCYCHWGFGDFFLAFLFKRLICKCPTRSNTRTLFCQSSNIILLEDSVPMWVVYILP